ncbi:hypothetical protein DNU06_13095 [Putridiphycobacter roseus]|uniref:Uncharacterized protein n=1 Tax=Putridiphycobacter roseus TaxID=2219161 RepID=A0A2W1NPD2_9FLAO|nr:oligosaccharide flippase family protein [Putridiphycobacter roseus]PZE16478.1 hypothetical protein DNU06_13095 [Putridiphycobacter roseus]
MLKKLRKNKLVFSIGSYTMVNLINQGIPFLMLPILTNYLSPTDYGILTNIESLITITVTLIGINFAAAFSRHFVNENFDVNGYFKTGLKVIFFSFLLVSLLYFFLADFIYQFTAIPIYIIRFISIYALLNVVLEGLLTLWRMEEKPFHYGILRISKTLIEVTISVSLVVGLEYNWQGRFIGLCIGVFACSLFALFYLVKMGVFKAKITKKYRKQFLTYGLPLIPHSISGVIIFYSDKIVITKMIGIEENGLYSVAFTLGMVISLLQNSFNQAWVPWLFKKLALRSKDEDRKLVKITYLYMAAMMVLVFILWLVAPILYLFIGSEFKSGMSLVAIVGLGFAFNGMYKMMVNYLFFAERTKIISIVTLGIAVLNIGLNIVFIKQFGLVGSAYASALSFFVQFIVTWYISNLYYPMPWFKLKKE